MTAPDWTLVELGANRIRYRERAEYAREASAFEVEYWNEGREEWRAVRSPSSRDWFALGMRAGQQAPVQEELKL